MGEKQKRDIMDLLDRQNSKNQKFVIDKIFHPLDVHFDTNSLSAWLSYYYSVHVKGAPEKTEAAKKKDLSKFIYFFRMRSVKCGLNLLHVKVKG